MPGKLERRRRVRHQLMEPAERDWCVRRLQHDHVLPLGSLTYRQAALVIALLSAVRSIKLSRCQAPILSLIRGLLYRLSLKPPMNQ